MEEGCEGYVRGKDGKKCGFIARINKCCWGTVFLLFVLYQIWLYLVSQISQDVSYDIPYSHELLLIWLELIIGKVAQKWHIGGV